MKIRYSIPLNRDVSPELVELELDSTALPGARFIEHEFDRTMRVSTKKVLASSGSMLFISDDLGETWRSIVIEGVVIIYNSFICSNGDILVSGSDKENREMNRISVVRGSEVIVSNIVGRHGWHATFSIDESDDCIIFSEYPDNNSSSKQRDVTTSGHVFRSRDHGFSWDVVFIVEYPDIRHFHTCTYFPDSESWVISSGDSPSQSRFWLSLDGGDGWNEITDPSPHVLTSMVRKQSIHRTVVMHGIEDHYLWATDDLVGKKENYERGFETLAWLPIEGAVQYRVLVRNYSLDKIVLKPIIEAPECEYHFEWSEHILEHEYLYRVQFRVSEDEEWIDSQEYAPLSREYRYHPLLGEGDNITEITRSRLVRSPKSEPLSIEVLCELGMHVRSMIDVGEAYLMISESKYLDLAPNPQVFLVFKDDLYTSHHLFNIPNRNRIKTGATYSRNSISAIDGVFFTLMQKGLLFDENEIVRWKISFSETESMDKAD